MGLLSSLVGWDQDKAACNAVLANCLVAQLDQQKKKQIADLLVSKLMSCRVASSPIDALKHISRSERVQQMNFIANACNDLGIAPPVSDGVGWRHIPNPFRANAHARDISAAITFMKKRNPSAALEWPGDHVSVDFVSWTN